MLTVADVMTPYPIRVAWTAELALCAHLVDEHRLHELPVVSDRDQVRGLLTDTRLFRHGALRGHPERLWVPYDPDEPAHTAGDLAGPAELVVPPDLSLGHFLRRLLASAQHAGLAAGDDGRLLGTVTEAKVLAATTGLLPDEAITEVASSPVHTVDRADDARIALDLMDTHRVRHVVVLSDELLYGVVSFRDLVDAGIPAGEHMRVDAVITGAEVVHATPETTLRAAARRMNQWRIGSLPVVDAAERPFAILTRTDLLRVLARALQRQEARDAEATAAG